MRDTFEYAVLRVVPRVERGESLNAGVLVYCRQRDYLGSRVHLDADRLRALDPTADADAIRKALQAAADAALAPRVTAALLGEVLAQVPDEWLDDAVEGADALRERYAAQLLARLAARDAWLPGVVAAAATGGSGRRRAPRGENRPAWLGPPPPQGVTQR